MNINEIKKRLRVYQKGGNVLLAITPNTYAPSKSILDYIKSTELFLSKWYQDGNGYWTVGYGFKDNDGSLRKKYPNGMSRLQADLYFNNIIIPERVKLFLQGTPNFHKLNLNQRDALFSYLYNIGYGSYTKKSPGLLKALKTLNHSNIVKNIDFGYNDIKNKGLRLRRDYERKLYNKK